MQRRSPFLRLALPLCMLWTCSVLVGCAASSEIRPSPRIPPPSTTVASNVRKGVAPDIYDRDFERADAVINPALIGEEVHEDQTRTSKEAPKDPDPHALKALPASVLSAGNAQSTSGST